MPSFEAIITVLIAGFMISASPGPSMMYVLSRSVGQSRAAGFASSVGLAIGGVLLAIGSALGLAVIFEYSSGLYRAISFAGAAYLFYLGYDMISNAGKEKLEISRVKSEKFSKIMYQGILVELLNPKTILFFLAFLPQFVDYSRADVTTQMMILGILVPLTAIPSDVFVSVVGGTLTNKLSRHSSCGIVLTWIGGLILIALALRIVYISVQV